MKLNISFKNIEHTPALDEKIKSKSEKFKKYLDGNFEVFWTCYVRDREQWAEIKLVGPSFNYHAKASSDSLYKSFDKVISKLEKQLHKKKDKWKNHLHHKHDVTAKSIPLNEILKDEEEFVDKEYFEDIA